MIIPYLWRRHWPFDPCREKEISEGCASVCDTGDCEDDCFSVYPAGPEMGFPDAYWRCVEGCVRPCNVCLRPLRNLSGHTLVLQLNANGMLESSACTPCSYHLFLRLEGGLCNQETPTFRPKGIRTYHSSGEENDDGRYFIIPNIPPMFQDADVETYFDRQYITYWKAEAGEDDSYQGKIAVVYIGTYGTIDVARYVIKEFAGIFERYRSALASKMNFYGDDENCVFSGSSDRQAPYEMDPYVSHSNKRCVGTEDNSHSKSIRVTFSSVMMEGDAEDRDKARFTIYVDGEDEYEVESPIGGGTTMVKYGEWHGEGQASVVVPACSSACLRAFVDTDLVTGPGSEPDHASWSSHIAIDTPCGDWDAEALVAAEEAFQNTPPQGDCEVYDYLQLKELETEMEE